MRADYFIITLILGILFISFASAACTVTFDKSSYFPSETVTASLSCSGNDEKNQAYTLNWTFNGTTQLELDTGTTPPTVSTLFYATYILNSSYAGTINATLSGTNLEGNDGANVSGTSAKVLTITDLSFSSSAFIGSLFAVDFKVTNNQGKSISNAQCKVYGTDNTDAPLQMGGTTLTYNGLGSTAEVLDSIFTEGNQYLCKIRCFCGIANTSSSCVDEDGNQVFSSAGSTSVPFTLNTWLTSSTLVDQTEYTEKEEIVICANLTNSNYTSRVPVEIYHQVRCSSGIDNNNDLDRVLVISDGDTPDRRGISAGTTQMQCKRFVVPEPRYLQGKSSQCYASTEVWVLNSQNEKIVRYLTTSPAFNITISSLQLQPDWERIADYQWNSIINLTGDTYHNWNGTGIANIDLRLDKVASYIRSYEQDVLPEVEFNNFLLSDYIKNWTTSYCNGTTVNSALEINEDGNAELELRDVGISNSGSNCYNVTLNINSFEERSTEALEEFNSSLGRSATALEGIENKTGTFHLDVACPSTSTIGGDMSCVITAYIEDFQTVQKEVDFTCHISDGTSQYSSTNFNQMITKSAVSLPKTFLVPSTFTDGTQYVLQCYADYYNLGSRRDSFYDTFIAAASAGGGGSASGAGGNKTAGRAPITGGAVDEGKGIFSSPPIEYLSENKWWFVFVIGVLALLILVVLIRNKKYVYSTHKTNWNSVLKNAVIFLTAIVAILGICAGGYYAYNSLQKINKEIQQSPEETVPSVMAKSYSLIQDNLFRGIILTAFIILMIVILFKVFNIRGEIRFGCEGLKYNGDRRSERLHNKLNRLALKNEIEREKEKLGNISKTRKISAEEFNRILGRFENRVT
ncbi:hypothetical protein J4402_03900 [Candidatus Pacearchaeota archaeon]|nr:hypothetical protein [Candidatus Pacearchaeota archaeon]